MDKLIQGAIKFREEDFNDHKELYESLKKAQDPSTLFIGCADSRVVPNLITNTMPGELFVVRNMGNIVPPYDGNVQEDGYFSTISAIEYAIKILKIKNIIICGHSNCNACIAVYDDTQKFKDSIFIKKWIELLKPVRDQVLLMNPSSKAKRMWLTEQLNIKQQISNLLTYPFIQDKLKELNIFGWYYIIQTGEIMNYDIDTQEFRLIE